MRLARGRVWFAGLLSISLVACGDNPIKPTTLANLTGDWGIFSITTTSCPSSLPLGFAEAPRGAGSATISQDGQAFDGELRIANTPAGMIHGTITDGNVVSVQFNLDGQNVGPATPCRVVGSGTGRTDRHCFVQVTGTADFACPFECNPAMVDLSLRGHIGEDTCPR